MQAIASILYSDPQRRQERRCPRCHGCTYPPGYFCPRCQRDAP